MSAISGKPIPGLVLKLRNLAILLSTACLVVAIFETVRTSDAESVLPNEDWRVWAWLVTCILGSALALTGTLMLQKYMILFAAITLCCLLVPITPAMIVLTTGPQAESYIAWTFLFMIVGFLEMYLFTNLMNELELRDLKNKDSLASQEVLAQSVTER